MSVATKAMIVKHFCLVAKLQEVHIRIRFET